jgi:CMP/dCMP kinase
VVFLIITISGVPGSGKSSVAKLLAGKLGFRHYSTGDFMRVMAEERGITLLELSRIAEKDALIDRELDAYSAKLGEEEDNFVLDSRLGFHFIPGSVKIFLGVSPEEAAKRIFSSPKHKLLEKENKDYEATLRNIKNRMESERKRYYSLYKVDYEDKKSFDLAVSTENKKIEEVLSEIMLFLGKQG